jgi:competence protein ComEC
LWRTYRLSALLWLAVAPLAAAHHHLVSPAGLLLLPPLGVLTALAMLFGFPLLPLALIGGPVARWAALPMHWALLLCDRVVDWADASAWSYFYVGEVPEWWAWAFYLGMGLWLTQASLRRRPLLGVTLGLVWVCVGLLGALGPTPEDELRITFLSVGHGGCVVLETPEGRTLLYDAGAIGGPEAAQRQIAPYLRSRGIRRIDEVFLSHADLDHFNGLIELTDRFTVGQVSCTPTFSAKKTPGVRHTLGELQRRNIPVRIVKAGDVLTTGSVTLEVLHPPAVGPEGNENARSLVLFVSHNDHHVLLTGDLEGAGMDDVLRQQPRAVGVLMAPHHGSATRSVHPADLVKWAGPRVVVSCQGPPRRPEPTPQAYRSPDVIFLSTWAHGAITVRSGRGGLVVETFTTKQRIVVRKKN